MAELKIQIPDQVIKDITLAVPLTKKEVLLSLENMFLRMFTSDADFMKFGSVRKWTKKRVDQIMPQLLKNAEIMKKVYEERYPNGKNGGNNGK
jgi:hypothetical protein